MLDYLLSHNSCLTICNILIDTKSIEAVTYQRRNDDKPRDWCDYCNQPRHTGDNCWKLHGKPANWKSKKPGDRTGRAFPTANEAKDRSSGRTIDNARMINVLYYFDDNLSCNKEAQGFCSISSNSIREQIMIWHCR